MDVIRAVIMGVNTVAICDLIGIPLFDGFEHVITARRCLKYN
jgi:hypothetical protein